MASRGNAWADGPRRMCVHARPERCDRLTCAGVREGMDALKGTGLHSLQTFIRGRATGPGRQAAASGRV